MSWQCAHIDIPRHINSKLVNLIRVIDSALIDSRWNLVRWQSSLKIALHATMLSRCSATNFWSASVSLWIRRPNCIWCVWSLHIVAWRIVFVTTRDCHAMLVTGVRCCGCTCHVTALSSLLLCLVVGCIVALRNKIDRERIALMLSRVCPVIHFAHLCLGAWTLVLIVVIADPRGGGAILLSLKIVASVTVFTLRDPVSIILC